MKHLKKLVAMLLVSVMALTMLTACGGGSGSSSSSIFKYTGQQLTDAINKKLNANLTYDENLGDRFATAINAAGQAGQKFDDPDVAGAMIEMILESAGFGDDTEVAVTVAQKGAAVDLVASGLSNSIVKEGYSIKDKKIGYAGAKLNIDGDYYMILAVLQ